MYIENKSEVLSGLVMRMMRELGQNFGSLENSASTCILDFTS